MNPKGYRLFTLGILLSILPLQAFVYTDTGCPCALTKSGTTTPGAGGSTNVGCTQKTDWNGQSTKWCLTDQTNGQCGTYKNSFGWVDSCTLAGFPTTFIQPATILESDQTNTTFYSGQTFNISWTYRNMDATDTFSITYQGVNTRTIGSGIQAGANSFRLRLSDSSNAPATNVPLTLTHSSSSGVSSQTVQRITFIQSRVQNLAVYDGQALASSSSSFPCDNRQLTVSWRGLGQAQFGTATVAIKSNSGGGSTTVGTAISGLAAATMTVNYTLPRSFLPNGVTRYSALVSVQEPGQNAYTLTFPSTGFALTIAATTTPSASMTPTPTRSTTASPSISGTPTPTISETPSQTPSHTPTHTPTPSQTPTPYPKVDIEALRREAKAEQTKKTNTNIGIGLGTSCILVGVAIALYKLKTRKEIAKRKLRQKMSARMALETRDSYLYKADSSTPNVIMYQINMPGKVSFPPKNTPVN
jgi:hypothetical protein